MKTARLLPRFALALFPLLLAAPGLDAQCAMCKEAVTSDKAAGGNLADGISYSILFMLSLPVAILGGFSLAIWNAYRKNPQPRE